MRQHGEHDTRINVSEAAGQVQTVVAAIEQQHTLPADSILAALTTLRRLRDELSQWEPQIIAAARDQGVSWAELAVALGLASRQAAERRYLRLRPTTNGAQTREERVEAERTKRAADRAVAAWARQNSGLLRQLASQISVLEGLSHLAQRQVDLVSLALAGDDASSLLTPLIDVYTHLHATHAGLARQIDSVINQTEELRRHTHEQRQSRERELT